MSDEYIPRLGCGDGFSYVKLIKLYVFNIYSLRQLYGRRCQPLVPWWRPVTPLLTWWGMGVEFVYEICVSFTIQVPHLF